jgi:phosphatidylglycerophosphatase A
LKKQLLISFSKYNAADKFQLILATGFGSGLFPFASGTAGSAVAVALYFLFFPILSPAHWLLGLLFLLAATAIAIQCSDRAEQIFQKKDDGRVVIDEFIGQWIALYLIPLVWWTPIAAFFLFRLFDIVKPFPANQLQQVRGGWGIVLDDLVAGIYSNLVLQLILWLAL